jgi:hypothetical protein
MVDLQLERVPVSSQVEVTLAKINQLSDNRRNKNPRAGEEP